MKLQYKYLQALLVSTLVILGCNEDSIQGHSTRDDAKCGNGVIEGDEACDDGNAEDGDGCSADCLIIENDYACETAGELCKKLVKSECGNGVIEGDEACDDGNAEDGDGCSADCSAVDTGYVCKKEGKACELDDNTKSSVCGNGVIEGNEVCDDGNAEDGDGCSADCSTIEEGYVCRNSGRSCLSQEDISDDEPSVCGDGFIAGSEVCDDGNIQDGDGCSADCLLIEIGFECRNSGKQCVPETPDVECGNGVLEAGETCDDRNVIDGDGCSSECQVEEGWICLSEGQNCTPKQEEEQCGDGILTASEACDDGNNVNADGCSSVCLVESGWICSEESCSTVCGDGILAGSETCDDGNTNDGDGCSSACSVENGWTCSSPGLSCTPKPAEDQCGDGILTATEACDDRNTTNGDGCSSSCQIESGWQCPTVGSPCTKIPVVTKKSISILAIGNSFSQDAMTYLYDVLAAVGYEDITIANLYYGGCSLAEHVSFIKGDTTDYTFQVHSNLDGGSLVTVDNFKASDAFNFTGKFNNKVLTGKYSNQTLKGLDNGWDYISVQQSSPLGGIASTYILDSSGTGKNDINYIIDKAKAKSSKAKIIWHMTWPFQAGSVRKQFVYYGKDQLKMYNTTVNTTKEQILTNSKINMIIPAGTAIQNLRTSIIGDNLTRDGYHLSKSQGRLALAMMWAKQITGENINSITTSSLYTHNGVASKNLEAAYKPLYTDRMIAAMKKAVNDAYSNPFVVTPATEGFSETTYKPNTELQRVFTNAGYNLNNYQELPFGVVTKAYYNATNSPSAICNITNIDDKCSSILVSAETGGTSTSLLNSLAATRIFNRYELPVGSVIVLKDGYQYRPEAWTDYNTTVSSSKRPDMVTTQIVPITTSWWGDFKYRAFNISKKGRPELTASEMNSLSSALAIFVPKESVNTDKVLKDKGYDPSKYKKLELELLNDGYWNPTTAYSWTSTINDNRFPTYITRSYAETSAYATTKIFTKSDLPNGTLIVAAPGYQYRPDAWVSLSNNISSSSRPDMVKTTTSAGSVVSVNSAWWGSFNYRVFNLSKLDKPKLNYLEQYKFNDKFAIYVPK